MAVPTGNLTRWLTVAKLGTAALVAFALLLPLRPLWHPAVSALDIWDDAIFFLRYAEVFHHTGVLAWNPGDMVPRVKYPAPSATIRNPHVATA